MRTTCSFRFLLLPILGLLASQLHADDWPQFRGPYRNGVSDEKLTLLPGGPRQIWEASVGDGYASLAVANGRLYTVGRLADQTGVLRCLDAATGRSIWEVATGCEYQVSTPSVADDRVYLLTSPEGKPAITCHDAKTGAIIWNRKMPAPDQIRGYGYAGSPLLCGELVVLNVGTGLALDRKTGAIVWHHQGLAGLATPVLYEEADRSRVLIFAGEMLLARDVLTGELLWSIPWKTRLAANCCDPIYHKGKVFVSSGYGREGVLFDVSTGKPRELWSVKGTVLSSGFLLDENLYSFAGKEFACLDFATGERRWAFRIGPGSVLLAGGKLILMSDQGELTIGELSSDSFVPIVQKQVLEGITWTPAALSDGKLYVRNREGKLVCIRIGKETD